MRVVIGEDQLLFRKGLGRLLEEAGFDVVGQAGDAVDLRRKVSAHRPDVAVVDIQMPPTNTDDGLRAAMQIRVEHPRVAGHACTRRSRWASGPTPRGGSRTRAARRRRCARRDRRRAARR